MTFLDRIRSYAAKATPAPSKPPVWLLAEGAHERWGLPDLSQAEAQATLYTKLSWVQIAISAVSRTVATTPLSVQRMTGEDTRAIVNHPFEQLLRRPNPMDSRYEFIAATYAWRAVTGNCYWWLNRSGPDAPPDEVFIIPANRILPVPDGQSFLRGYMYDSGEQKIPLETWEVVHFRDWNPLSSYVGMSRLQAVRMDVYGDLAAQEYNAAFYAKDNAKMAGILAFADPIDDPRWKRLRAEIDEQHGGAKGKRVMFMRNVGPGGVQWIATQMNRADMQYLEQRHFTKEEIFNLYAPGLASILAVNATEANSTAGKDTFLTMAVYPEHVAIAEKITQNPLPSYGDDLTCAFEDVRRVDTQIELQEQAAYERSHTILEVRAKYYQDKPIGDGRDLLLPAEVGKGLTDARAPEDKPAPAPPPQLAPPSDALPSPDELMQEAGKALDRRRWRDKVLKAMAAGRGADVPFDPEYLTDDEAMTVRASLKRAVTADDVWKAVEG